MTIIRKKKHRDGSVSIVSKTRLPLGVTISEAFEQIKTLNSDRSGKISNQDFEKVIGNLSDRSRHNSMNNF